jgi:hypothetical protein
MRTGCHQALMLPPNRYATMKPEEQTEEENILAFTIPDEALEHAADTNFSLGNCTEVTPA